MASTDRPCLPCRPPSRWRSAGYSPFHCGRVAEGLPEGRKRRIARVWKGWKGYRYVIPHAHVCVRMWAIENTCKPFQPFHILRSISEYIIKPLGCSKLERGRVASARFRHGSSGGRVVAAGARPIEIPGFADLRRGGAASKGKVELSGQLSGEVSGGLVRRARRSAFEGQIQGFG